MKIPKMVVPDRSQLGKQIDIELSQLLKTISTYLAGSRYHYSFGVDISTTKGMLISFLGVTAHVWSNNNSCIRSFGLDMAPLTEAHTAMYVFQTFASVLKAHKLSESRTLRVVTDCGRNVMNAF